MKKMKQILCCLLVLAMLASLAACGKKTAEAEKPAAGDTGTTAPAAATALRATCTTTPETMDPARGSGENDDLIFVNVYETLVKPSETDASAEPLLATEWTPSEDGKSWTFKLRDDVKFSDGTALTSADVQYSMERMLTIGEGYAFIFTEIIDKVETPDEHTVVFHLKKPFGPFVNALTCFRVVNKAVIESNTTDGMYGENKDYGTGYLLANAAGSGPYVIKEFKIHESVTLEKNPNYWQTIPEGAPQTVVITELQDAATSKMMLTNGEVDMIHGHQEATTLQTLIANQGIETVDIPEMGLNFFMMNTKKAPTDDVHIRKAIAYATNYQAMSDIYGGMPSATGPVPSTLWGYTDDVTTFDYNLEKAKEEIALSKYASNLQSVPLDLSYIQGNGDTGKLAMLLASDLESVGFKVQINETPWVLFCDNEGTIETSPNITNAFCTSNYPEAGSILEFKYASWTVGNWNQNEWLQDEKFDTMLNEALGTVDDEARMAKYAQIQQYITGEVVPSLYPFISVIKPVFNANRFSSRMTEGNVHPSLQYNYYYADYTMK